LKLILLSGGSGKRLWPLSNDSRSKQFLKILKDQDGNMQSMVQRVWNQIEKVGLSNSTFIATGKSQVDMINNQLEENVELIVEPSRRDTFPAIALASSYIFSEKDTNRDEIVVVLPVDPFVADQFFEKVKELENVLNNSESNLALIGVKPTFPSSKYGYIVQENTDMSNGFKKVKKFVEKPKEKEATLLIQQDSLWNCGVFAFKLDYIIKILENKGLPTNYKELVEIYDDLPKISFDYEVVENTDNISVLPYEGYWKDLGTWNTLTEEMGTNIIGKGLVSNDSENVHLINELDIPVTVLGVKNLVVAASPDGIMVTDKEASPRIKELVGNFNNRPMYEERLWGWYKVLDYTMFEEGTETLTKRICITKGKSLSYQQHFQRSEVWTIIKGIGEVVLDEKLYHVSMGDVIKVPIASKHAIRAISDLEIIEVQHGSQLIEEDIVRLEKDWNDIINRCKILK